MQQMIHTKDRVHDLISYVEAGRIEDAIREFYDDNVEMQENTEPATVGKPANTEREKDFVNEIAQIHQNRAQRVVVDGDSAAINWLLEYTSTGGKRIKMDQVALQTWKDGKIVKERFFYDSASVVQG